MPVAHELVLALDVGTSSARAGLYDDRGRLLPATEAASAYAPAWSEDGGATLSAARLLAALAAAMDGALAAAARLEGKPRVAAVGISTFWHSLLGLDAAGRPVTPVLLWADTRAESAVPLLVPRLGAGYHQRTGAPVHASFWPAKLTWLRRAQPETFRRAARWVSFAEYLFLRLFGAPACSVSMASATGLWNYRRGAWDAATLAALGLSPSHLTPVADGAAGGGADGRLQAPWPRRWPLLAAVPWFPAWGDGACANAGSGAIARGRWAVTIGTSSAMRAVVPAAQRVRLPPGLWRYALDGRRHLIGGALSEGGNVFHWLRETLAWPPQATDAGLEKQIARGLRGGRGGRFAGNGPDGHGLTILPYFAGERSPGWSRGRRAVIAGLTLATTPGDLLQAGLEAVALRLAAVHADLRTALGAAGRGGADILAGGAALRHSALWTQMLADALGAPVHRLSVAESSARGAALLTWERLGRLDLEALPAPREHLFLPRPAATAAYRAARQRQDELRRRLAVSG